MYFFKMNDNFNVIMPNENVNYLVSIVLNRVIKFIANAGIIQMIRIIFYVALLYIFLTTSTVTQLP